MHRMQMITLGRGVIALAVIGLGMLLGASTYESIVMAPNFGARVPESLQHARGFFVASNPGMFFRVFAPATQVVLLLAVILNWRARHVRWWLLGALVLLVLTDVITFSFHYPRNALMFQRPFDQVSVAQLQEAAQTWGPGNLLRVALLAAAILSALRGLIRSGEKAVSSTSSNA